jgi:hypothetical protein
MGLVIGATAGVEDVRLSALCGIAVGVVAGLALTVPTLRRETV